MRHHDPIREHPGPAPLARIRRRLAAHVLGGVLGGLALVSGSLLVPTTAHAADGGVAAVGASYDVQVLDATNAVRAKHGLKPLKPVGCPDRYARSWTRHLAAADAMYHQALGPILKQCDLKTAGENLAWSGGSLSAQQVVKMWMASPGHRRNILNPKYRYLGTDAWRSTDTGRTYVGQVFGG